MIIIPLNRGLETLVDDKLVEFASKAETSEEHFDAVIEWMERVYPGHNITESYVEGRFTEIHEDDARV